MPTFNRSFYAKRSIDFWSNTNVNLIVMDGSKEPIESKYIDCLAANVTYIHSQTSWVDRILAGSNLSRTPYTMLVNDDEFFLPSALEYMIDYLDNDKSISCVKGSSAVFSRVYNSNFYRLIYSDYDQVNLSSESYLERIKNLLVPYKAVSLFGIIRTEVFKISVQVAKKFSQIPTVDSWELGFVIANSYQGKVKVLPILYWLRSIENPPIWDTKGTTTLTWAHENYSSKVFQEISNRLDVELKSILNQKDNAELGIFGYAIGIYLMNYSKLNPLNTSHQFHLVLKTLKQKVKNNVELIRFLYFHQSSFRHSSWLSGSKLSQTITSTVNLSDLQNIESHLGKSSSNRAFM
jgi:glycosyltransferase domain-containing protein